LIDRLYAYPTRNCRCTQR